MDHEYFLLEALELAKQRRGFCAPNPSVGAVVARHNQVISTGVHFAHGSPHAEVVACQHLSDNLTDVILYVTLEPCCHWGRTPPCTDFILSKGIKKVIYGYQDPNPLVAGQGEAYLKQHGVDCHYLEQSDITKFYQSYAYWTKNKLPWVTTKLAISIDAKIAKEHGYPADITGEEARKFTHQHRLQSDAILTSVKTILNDNPAMNVRLSGNIIPKNLYILDNELAVPLDAQIMKTTAKITVFYAKEDSNKIKQLSEKSVNCRKVTKENNHLNLSEVLKCIGEDGIHDLWVEAGGKVFSAFIVQQLANKSFIYIAPKMLGPTAYPAFESSESLFDKSKEITWYPKGNDVICEIDWF